MVGSGGKYTLDAGSSQGCLTKLIRPLKVIACETTQLKADDEKTKLTSERINNECGKSFDEIERR